MAKFDLKFLDTFDEGDWISCNFTSEDVDTILIKSYDRIKKEHSFTYLDKSTAIKFAKTLRTEINKIQE
jgi:hypothetical protein